MSETLDTLSELIFNNNDESNNKIIEMIERIFNTILKNKKFPIVLYNNNSPILKKSNIIKDNEIRQYNIPKIITFLFSL